MNSGPPYRTPCNGWARPQFSGPCYQHKRKSESAVPVFYNVTKFEGATPVNGTSGPEADPCAEGDVAAAGNCYHEAKSMVSGAKTDDAGYSVGETTVTLAAAGTGGIAAGDVVAFDGEGEYLVATGNGNVSAGGDLVLAAPGLLAALDDTDHDVTVLRHTHDFSSCHKSGWKAVRADKAWHGMFGWNHCSTDCLSDHVKYRTVNRTLTASIRCTGIPEADPPVPEEESPHMAIGFERTYTVAKNTGVITCPVCVQPSTEDADAFINTTSDPNKTGAGSAAANLIHNFLLSRDCGLYAMDNATWGADVFSESKPMDWLNGTDTPTGPWGAPTIVADEPTVTHIGFTLTSPWAHPDFGIHFELVVRITADLSDAYDIADCCADAFDLLASYDLTDDKVYPWRTDNVCCRVPVLRYEENANTPESKWEACDWVDPSTHDEKILGVPNPAGYGCEVFVSGPWGHFAFGIQHEINDVGVITGAGYGEWTPEYLPKTATWWSLLSDEGIPGVAAGAHPEGAYVVASETQVQAQKWCAIKETHDSVNFFRPCGADRDAVGDDAPCAVDGSQYCWNGSSAARPKAWPICGHVAFTATEEAGTVMVTLAESASYLRAGDYVSFVKYAADYARTTTDGSKLVASVAGDFLSFTYEGSLPDAAATHVVSHVPAGFTTNMGAGPQDAPHYQWNDSDAKGDFTYREWITDNCASPEPSVVFTCTSDCIKRQPCNPSVVCVSPNGEAFQNGVTYELPGLTGPNEKFQAIVVTEMPDPFWVRPYGCESETPVDVCATTPSDPRCAQALVEPLCAAPDGAPTLPFDLPCVGMEDGECAAPANGGCGEEVDWV